MSTIGVVTDSHSGILADEAKELDIMVLPMPFFIEGECFYENTTLTREEFLERLVGLEDISTSQPSPQDVMDLWDEALKKWDEIVYIPISSGLSGSCQTAMALAAGEPYEGKVYVVDNGRIATPLHVSILDAVRLAKEGKNAKEIKDRLEAVKDKMNIYVAVQDLKYLKHGGRISATTAAVGSMLNIKPILNFNIGTLTQFAKSRGFAKAKKMMIEAVKNDIEEKYKDDFENGNMYLMAASSASREETEQWVDDIKNAFPGHEVLCDDLTMGVSCHIGPGGLGVAYAVKA